MRTLTLTIPYLLAAFVYGCDHGLDPAPPGPTGIAGQIVFEGEWPDQVAQVAVVVYAQQPQTISDFGSLAGWDTDVPLGVATYDYFVEIQGEGDYGWGVVVWRAEGQLWNFTSLLDCFHQDGAATVGAVTVVRGEISQQVDIAVDLDVIDVPIPLREWACTRDLPDEIIELAGG